MAAENLEITESNRAVLEHILTDLHDALRLLRDQGLILARHDQLLDEFRPLLNQFRTPLASALTRRRANGRRNPD